MFEIYLQVIRHKCHKNKTIQAGAELCQAQEKLGLAKPALPSKTLRLSFILKVIEVVVLLPKN